MFRAFIIITVAAAALLSSACAADQRFTLHIKSDGSCRLTNETVEPRVMAEQQMRMWEQMRKQSEAQGDDDVYPPLKIPAPPAETKPLTDEELGAKIRELWKSQVEQEGADSGAKIDLVDVQKERVRTVSTRGFAT